MDKRKLSGLKARKDYYQAMEKFTGIEERDPIADVTPTRNSSWWALCKEKP